MATAQPIVPFVPVAFGRYWLTATAFLVQVNAGFRALLQSECPQLEVFFRGRPSFLTHKLSWKLVCECCGPMEPALRGALKQTRYCRIIVDGNNLIHPITDCAGQGEKFDERRNSGIQGMKAMCSFR